MSYTINYNYNKIGSTYKRASNGRGRRSITRGFKINPRRFSVQRLRCKVMYLWIRVLSKWRCSLEETIEFVKRGVSWRRNNNNYGVDSFMERSHSTSSRRSLVQKSLKRNVGGCNQEFRTRSFSRTNSFYSEAIADCLDFIKRTSFSADQKYSVPT